MVPPLSILDDNEKEEFVATKVNSIVTRRGKSSDLGWLHDANDLCVIDAGTDEISADANVRTASRSFRQTFDVPATERLVNCKFDPVFYTMILTL